MSLPPPTERQGRIIWLALTGLAMATLVALLCGLIWGLGQVIRMLAPVIWPIAVAGILAYLLDPVVDFLEKRRVARSRAIIMVFGLALLVVGLVFGAVVPQIVNETRLLTARIPEYAGKVEQRFQYWLNHPPAIVKFLLEKKMIFSEPKTEPATGEKTELAGTTNAIPVGATNTIAATQTNQPAATLTDGLKQQTFQQATEYVTRSLPKIGPWLFGQVGRVAAWFGILAGLALIPVYTFYFLLEKHGISSQWTDYLPVSDSTFKNELVFVLSAINNYLIAFFRGQVLVAVCDGIMYSLGFFLVGLPYAFLIGFIAIFLTMIPFLGAIVTCVTALIIALVQFGDWLHPLLVIVVFGCVQALEGLVISPRIMGGRVGLHPVTIIIAVMAGTTLLGGLLGGILAIPLTAALRVIMLRYVWKRELER